MNLVKRLLAAGFKNEDTGFDEGAYSLAWYGLFGNRKKHVFIKGSQSVVLELTPNGGATSNKQITFFEEDKVVSQSIGGDEPRQEWLDQFLGEKKSTPLDPVEGNAPVEPGSIQGTGKRVNPKGGSVKD